MRFMEIANPEDQLALWKMVSDKMWAAFAQQIPKAFNGSNQPTAAPQSSAGGGHEASSWISCKTN